MNKKTRNVLIAVLVVVVVVCLAVAFWSFSGGETEPTPTPTPTPVVTPSPTPEPTETADPDLVDGLPVGAWPITQERKDYVEDSLTLYIPCIGITRAVHDGTDEATLNRGVGLYEYAQLPGEGNRNVSMAGHRNGIDKNGNITPYAPFYYIDQVGEGDYLYLYDSEHVYRYIYDSTWVVEPDDWSPIATTGYSCITITSCEPIGISDHRIICRGVLDQIFDYTDDFNFISNASEESETT